MSEAVAFQDAIFDRPNEAYKMFWRLVAPGRKLRERLATTEGV